MKLEDKFGMPVVDATSALTVVISRDDLDKGKVKDGQQCAIARACRRQLNANQVVIAKDVAFVEMPDGKGHRHMLRFGIPKESKRIIEANDRYEGPSTNEVVIQLIPKPPSQTLNAERKAMQKHYKKAKDPNHVPQVRRKRGEGSYEQRLVRDYRGQIFSK